MVNRMFNAIHEQSPACLKCPNMHKFAHIECASLYENAQIRRLSCVDSWVTQVTHEITWTNVGNLKWRKLPLQNFFLRQVHCRCKASIRNLPGQVIHCERKELYGN